LKWLWEVSDFENKEKIKTIIVAARSYANYYIDYAKKFPDDDYDASDDPNVFQKYLWYWLEKRSPNINRIVDETKWQVITYKWKMIKPWYFSSSNWKTLSFYEYCILKYSNMVCSLKARNYPYLQSVVDKWSDWMVKRGHGVWISWAWVTYFAEKWWTYDMIIKYFLKWVEVM
jgi:SpoIID/LytB domain protein